MFHLPVVHPTSVLLLESVTFQISSGEFHSLPSENHLNNQIPPDV